MEECNWLHEKEVVPLWEKMFIQIGKMCRMLLSKGWLVLYTRGRGENLKLYDMWYWSQSHPNTNYWFVQSGKGCKIPLKTHIQAIKHFFGLNVLPVNQQQPIMLYHLKSCLSVTMFYIFVFMMVDHKH